MDQCLALARQGEGRTAPNPAVGAIVLDASGQIVGRGFHKQAGGPHAEVYALDEAGERAAAGTLYVTLEPCCHHGRTPPCLDRVLQSQVQRVVVGMIDPNPAVAGKSMAALKAAGIDTVSGVREETCRRLNRGFIKRMTTGLPWVALKMAVTLDGRIADRSGASRWITGPDSRALVHELRNSYDCVLVGSGTVIADDPQLTVRDLEGGRNPLRAVIDSQLRCPARSRLFTDGEARTIVFAAEDAAARLADAGAREALTGRCEIIGVQSTPAGKLNLTEVLKSLCLHGINTVLAEGGAGLAGALLDDGLVDEVYWFIAAKILADVSSMPAVAGLERSLSEAICLKETTVRQVGSDILITGLAY